MSRAVAGHHSAVPESPARRGDRARVVSRHRPRRLADRWRRWDHPAVAAGGHRLVTAGGHVLLAAHIVTDHFHASGSWRGWTRQVSRGGVRSCRSGPGAPVFDDVSGAGADR
jgi:hypothetical protein